MFAIIVTTLMATAAVAFAAPHTAPARCNPERMAAFAEEEKLAKEVKVSFGAPPAPANLHFLPQTDDTSAACLDGRSVYNFHFFFLLCWGSTPGRWDCL